MFWEDPWPDGQKLNDIIQIPDSLKHTGKFKVSQFLQNGKWNLPEALKQLNPQLVREIEDIEVSNEEDDLLYTGKLD